MVINKKEVFAMHDDPLAMDKNSRIDKNFFVMDYGPSTMDKNYEP